MRYILVITAKRKGGKRHIVERSHDFFMLKSFGEKNINHKRYKVEIYKGNWDLVTELTSQKAPLEMCPPE